MSKKTHYKNNLKSDVACLIKAAQRKGFWGKLRGYFLAGILITAPISLTIYLGWIFIDFMDTKVSGILPDKYNPETYLPFSVPGLGFLIFLIVITLIGALTAGFVGRYFINLSERIVTRMPILRSIYAAIKQIFETILSTQSSAFREVVLFQYPRPGIWSLGFITGLTEGEIQDLTEDEVLNVFLPTTPNPTSGFLLFIPKNDLLFLEMSVEDGIKMVVSGGILTPKKLKEKSIETKNYA
ncbi:MAG: DUF502 domain-containing protein [Alphaproteobacteria bacterium]|nr:DUF502 domain-containing protein [Alphaproteobacteria bacterium]MBP9877230.1 DUF502 domain-containing protein [Alphaproteobacteria bacterium]